MSVLLLLTFLLCPRAAFSAVVGDDNYDIKGTAEYCFQKPTMKASGFEALPGLGWDNIRNKDMGQALVYNFSKCKLTDDRRFLIPDNVVAIPVKSSDVDVTAEIFTSMSSYKSSLSVSIGIHASAEASIDIISIGGSFSTEFQLAKKQFSQTRKKRTSVRVSSRYVRYRINIEPGTTLHPAFRKRLTGIAKYRQLNDIKMATYLSQVLIRDFGTHVVTSVDAGAVLQKQDFLSMEQWENTKSSEISIAASASFHASFVGLASAESKYDFSTKVTTEMKNKYKNSLQHSTIKAYGGTYFRSGNFSVREWEDSLDNGLVAVDRTGEPIYSLITAELLPTLPATVVWETRESVRDAFLLYYRVNVIRGCTDNTKPNFNIKANLDDGTCEMPTKEGKFGGMYQTCKMTQSGNGDICSGMEQKNPLTGDFSCPPGYQQIHLFSHDLSGSRIEHKCKGAWFWRNCRDKIFQSKGSYSVYWCTQISQSPEQFYKFGGLFTSSMSNPLTGNHKCPDHFLQLHIGTDASVCVSSDGAANDMGILFGGFYTCNVGNPLTLFLNNQSQKIDDSSRWPKLCPKGFSPHLAMILDNSCEINFCTNYAQAPGANQSLPAVRLPPYMDEPREMSALDIGPADVTLLSDDGSRWFKNEDAFIKMMQLEEAHSKIPEYERANVAMETMTNASSIQRKADDGDSKDLPNSAVAGISVGATLVCVAAAFLVFTKCKGRPKSSDDEATPLF